MCEFDNDKEDDPRKTKSWPSSPKEGGEPNFSHDYPDNVIAESKPPNPLYGIGKTFADSDSQTIPSEFQDIQDKKTGDLMTLDDDDDGFRRKANQKNRQRGRKNQYY